MDNWIIKRSKVIKTEILEVCAIIRCIAIGLWWQSHLNSVKFQRLFML